MLLCCHCGLLSWHGYSRTVISGCEAHIDWFRRQELALHSTIGAGHAVGRVNSAFKAH
jgi:hypothetical protein